MSPPDDHTVTDALLAASTLLADVSARSVVAVDDSLTPAQFRLLVVLSEESPRKVTEVADALGVHPSTATRAVDRLLTAGLLDRQTNPRSRRESQVSLTPAGRRLVRAVIRHRRAELAKIVAGMPQAQQNGLARALSAFTHAAGTMDP